MRRVAAFGLLWMAASGCAARPPVTHPGWQTTNVFYDNPAMVCAADPEVVWETVADVVDDYFTIREEEPVRLAEDVLIEGRLDTFPTVGSTLFEPWRGDSVGPYDKLESTLQSMRRYATVRVIPAQGGYLVDVAVFKELEDLAQPVHASAGAATFRYDTSLTRVVNPVGEQGTGAGWIDKGRDRALEQRIIGEVLARIGPSAMVWGPQ
ncbi:MAG: hypothetical protein HQ582_22775 [Planctomycetes bacterium]|nr:hypothetical protein [Planctomycetota bacterium]